MKTPSTSLVHVLLGKSIIETLLVGALAVVTFLNVFPPTFHGWGEISEGGISGWAVNNADPWERVELQLFMDGQFTATVPANRSRPDVAAAGWARDEWHGYEFPLSSVKPGRHEAMIYAIHDSGSGRRKSLQLLGDPIVFWVDAGGRFGKRNP